MTDYTVKVISGNEVGRGDSVCVEWASPERHDGEWIGLHVAVCEDSDDDDDTVWSSPLRPDEASGTLVLEGRDIPARAGAYVFRYHAVDGEDEFVTASSDMIFVSELPTVESKMYWTDKGSYITSVKVFINGLEECPEGYTAVANQLNAGNDGDDMRLCFQMAEGGSGLPMITDISVFIPEKEELPEQYSVVYKTVGDRDAELNAGLCETRVYICYALAGEGDGPRDAVKDVFVLDVDEGDTMPPGYEQVVFTVTGASDADTNSGTSGHDLFLSVFRASYELMYADNVVGLQMPPGYDDPFVSSSKDDNTVNLTGGFQEEHCLNVGVNEDGNYSFRSMYGKYLCGQENGSVSFSETRNEDCWFDARACGGWVMIRSVAHGTYLDLESEGAPKMTLPVEDAPIPKLFLLGTISELAVSATRNHMYPLITSGFRPIPEDLNSDAGGPYLQLWHRRGGDGPPITEIGIRNVSAKQRRAKAKTQTVDPEELKDPDYEPPSREESNSDDELDWELMSRDLNTGTTGDQLRLKVKRSPVEGQAPLTYLQIITGSGVLPRAGFVKCKVDLNEGAGGDYIYLAYQMGILSPARRAEIQEEKRLLALRRKKKANIYQLKRRAELRDFHKEVLRAAGPQHRDKWSYQGAPLTKKEPEEGKPAIISGMRNAGNTCYIDSTLFCMFGFSQAYDSLLVPPAPEEDAKVEGEFVPPTILTPANDDDDDDDEELSDDELDRRLELATQKEDESEWIDCDPAANSEALRYWLREAVINSFRGNEVVVSDTMDRLRFLLRACGWERFSLEDEDGDVDTLTGSCEQQDASELLSHLTDLFQHPYIGTVRKISYKGVVDPSYTDPPTETMRVLNLGVAEKPKAKKRSYTSPRTRDGKKKRRLRCRYSVDDLLEDFLFENPLEGYKRDVCPELAKLVEEKEAREAAEAKVEHESSEDEEDDEDEFQIPPEDAKKGGAEEQAPEEEEEGEGEEEPLWSIEYSLLPYFMTERLQRASPPVTEVNGFAPGCKADPTPAPLVLPLVIKRFNNALVKLNFRIHVPDTIDITPYIAKVDGVPEDAKFVMRLRGVVCHAGARLDMGHYYAFCKRDGIDGQSDEWFKFDDLQSDTKKVRRSNVMSDLNGWDYRAMVKGCYMCFYEMDPLP